MTHFTGKTNIHVQQYTVSTKGVLLSIIEADLLVEQANIEETESNYDMALGFYQKALEIYKQKIASRA